MCIRDREKHCDPSCRTSTNLTPFHAAALNGHLKIIKFFISELNCDPNTPGGNDQFAGTTALHLASQNGHLLLIKYLVEDQHCDPSCQDLNKFTPLYIASQYSHLDTVKYLTLEKHCDPLCKTTANYTPLHVAALSGHLEVIEFFISELSCNPNTPGGKDQFAGSCLLYTSPSPRDATLSRMPSSA